jgi:hypothetical protein
MSKLNFRGLNSSDVGEFDLSGPLRIEERLYGFYVVGRGTWCAVEDEKEGRKLIRNRRVKLRILASTS